MTVVLEKTITLAAALEYLAKDTEFYGWSAVMLAELDDIEIINEVTAWCFVRDMFDLKDADLLALLRAELLKGDEDLPKQVEV